MLRKVVVELQLIFYPQKDYGGACNANGEARDIEEGISFVRPDGAEQCFNKSLEHGCLVLVEVMQSLLPI